MWARRSPSTVWWAGCDGPASSPESVSSTGLALSTGPAKTQPEPRFLFRATPAIESPVLLKQRAALAQSVEHFTRNEKVASSILAGGSIVVRGVPSLK